MRTYSQSISAGGSWPLVVPGSLFRLIQTDSGEPVNIRFFRGGSVVAEAVDMEAGFFARPSGGFERVDIYSATMQTVKVLIADNDAGYDRFIVDINSSIGDIGVTVAQGQTVTNAAAVNVGTTATLLMAASSLRKGARFFNAGSVDVYLGGAGVTVANSPIKVSPGQLWIEDDAAAAAWYGVSATAGQSVRLQGVE